MTDSHSVDLVLINSIQMRVITNQLNSFFSQVSSRNYQFENISETKKQEETKKQKIIRKAFRQFKKSFQLDDEGTAPLIQI